MKRNNTQRCLPSTSKATENDVLSLDKIETVDSEEEVIFDANQYSFTNNQYQELNSDSEKLSSKFFIQKKRQSLQIMLEKEKEHLKYLHSSVKKINQVRSAQKNCSSTRDDYCKPISSEKLQTPFGKKKSIRIGSIIKSGFASYLSKRKQKSKRDVHDGKQCNYTPTTSEPKDDKNYADNTEDSILINIEKYDTLLQQSEITDISQFCNIKEKKSSIDDLRINNLINSTSLDNINNFKFK